MSDTFYLVIASDRHSDDEYALYRNIGAALAEAQRRADEAAAHYRAKQSELDIETPNGWLFYAGLEDAFSVHVEELKTPEASPSSASEPIDLLSTLKERMSPKPEWDGYIRFDSDCVINGTAVKAGTSWGPFERMECIETAKP